MKNIPADLSSVFAVHQCRLRSFTDAGAVPTVGSGPQARIDATKDFYPSEYSRRHGKYMPTPGVLGFLLSVGLIGLVLIQHVLLSAGLP